MTPRQVNNECGNVTRRVERVHQQGTGGRHCVVDQHINVIGAFGQHAAFPYRHFTWR